VSQGYLENGFRLGQWVGVQRTTYKTGQLSADRVARLEEVPGWSWNPHRDSWAEGFGYLCRFVQREGHSRVPQTQVEDAYRLGQWVGVQRTTYKTGQLAADRVARLEALPDWRWNTRKEA
jgi:hypothetical protein